MSSMKGWKPLGGKAYGHIPHLPGSRVGPGDHTCAPGQVRIATERVRDKRDRVVVQEKLDGSCVSVALMGGELLALGRAGYLAQSSPFEQHRLFAAWVRGNESRFRAALREGERLCGEWLAQAHGTRYDLTGREPFVAFDLMVGHERMAHDLFLLRFEGRFAFPALLHVGGAFSVADAMGAVGERLDGTFGFHGALDPVEGAVWRVERDGVVDYLVKFVRGDKVDGLYLPEQTGGEPVWNWRPR